MASGEVAELAFNYLSGLAAGLRAPREGAVQGPSDSPPQGTGDGAVRGQDKSSSVFASAARALTGNPSARRLLAAAGVGVVVLAAATAYILPKDVWGGLECPRPPTVAFGDVVAEEEAVRAAEVLRRRSVELAEEMRAIRRASESTPSQQKQKPPSRVAAMGPALKAFRALAALEPPARKTLATMARHADALRQQALGGDFAASEELALIPAARSGLRARLLEAVREARALAPLLPWARSLETHKALACSPGLLLDVESLATATEGVVGPMPGEDDAAARFDLGLYLSEIGVSAHEAITPFFGGSSDTGGLGSSAVRAVSTAVSWVADSGGSHVPAVIARAEELLQQGEESSVGPDRGDRGAARALRLYRHAKMLVSLHHDAAAEWRYRTAATLASAHGREKLAAHSLTRLGYFLMLRGRQREALTACDSALAIHADPLARYLAASLRRTLGDLRTNADVVAAKRELEEVAGQLPSKDLEKLREAAKVDMEVWGHVTSALGAMESGELAPERPSVGFLRAVHACLTTGDASQTLICLFGWFAFV